MFNGSKTSTKPKYEEQRAYVIKCIRGFLDGTGEKWEWDGFISSSAGYPELEALQSFCLEISDEYPPREGDGWCNAEGIRKLKSKLDELERT